MTVQDIAVGIRQEIIEAFTTLAGDYNLETSVGEEIMIIVLPEVES